jgi:hypothetical protein
VDVTSGCNHFGDFCDSAEVGVMGGVGPVAPTVLAGGHREKRGVATAWEKQGMAAKVAPPGRLAPTLLARSRRLWTTCSTKVVTTRGSGPTSGTSRWTWR